MASNPNREIELFAEAMRLSPPERTAFLERACGDDAGLRRRIEVLLRSNDRVGVFLEEPPTGSIGEERAKISGWEKPGDRVGRYKLLEQIGEGGCGIVFMAEQEEPVRRRVALKVIKPGMDTKSVIARFEAERQALALMDHRSIAKIFDAGATDSGRPYFVMELVQGVKITEYCDAHSLTTEERLKLFAQVCHAVQHAHQKGIIHRDIKPSNILVTKTDHDEALPVIIDFGIAKATTNQELTDKTFFTALEMLIGTPAYMSPEQAGLSGVDVDTRTDIYSLGVLLYELLTGSTPFDNKELLKAGVDEIRRVIREKEPARPSTRLSHMSDADLTLLARTRHSEPPTLIRSVRGDLDWIVMKSLEKDRTRRYPTANGLALDIQHFLAHEPIFARPPSKLYKLQKTAQRNKLLFASVSVIALLLIGSLIVVTATLSKERKSRRQSDEVTKFLESMLNGVGPSVARGRDTKMLREIVDETAQRVGREVADQPEVEAELCHLIGKLYEEIGDSRKGEAMARRALEIRLKQLGSDDLATAASMDLLGKTLIVQHKVPEAEKMYGGALAIRRSRLGNKNADTATSLNGLAEVFREQRKLDEAEAMVREALLVRSNLFGKVHLDVADSLRNLGMIKGYRSDWQEAERINREVLAIRRELLGDADHRVAFALEDVAWTLNAVRRFDEAQALHVEAQALLQRILGDTHPDVSKSLESQGQLLSNRGDFEGAEGVLRSVLAIQRNVMGNDNQSIAATLCNLARTLHERGKRPEAEAAWQEALSVGVKYWAPHHPDRLHAERGLCETLEALGKWSEAEALWRQSLAAWREREGIEEREPMYTLRRLGICLECARKLPEAETVFKEALAISRKKGDQDPEALVDLDRVVRMLMTQRKFTEAQQLLDRVLTPAFVANPASAGLLVLRVNVMGRRGRWPEAAADASRALEHQLTEHYRYHTLAALLAMAGNRPAYEQVCQRMATKFADSKNPYVLERIAQDNLLLPNAGADLEWMDKLSDKAVTDGTGTEGFPYFQACKAMSHYRMGNFPEAIAWGVKAAESSSGFAQAKALAVVAMAHWQLGQRNEAITSLSKGDALAPAFLPEKNDDLGESWVAWVMARISLDEAAELIQAGSNPQENSNQP